MNRNTMSYCSFADTTYTIAILPTKSYEYVIAVSLTDKKLWYVQHQWAGSTGRKIKLTPESHKAEKFNGLDKRAKHALRIRVVKLMIKLGYAKIDSQFVLSLAQL